MQTLFSENWVAAASLFISLVAPTFLICEMRDSFVPGALKFCLLEITSKAASNTCSFDHIQFIVYLIAQW